MSSPSPHGERPPWGVLETMLADVKRAWAGIPSAQERMREVTGEAWSDDRTIKAVVGPQGHLLELEIDPRVYRHPNSKALAATIVDTVRAAVEEATEKSRAILADAMPQGLQLDGLGGLTPDQLGLRPDAGSPRRGHVDG